MYSIFKNLMLKCRGLLLLLEFIAIIRCLWKRYNCSQHFQLVPLKYIAELKCGLYFAKVEKSSCIIVVLFNSLCDIQNIRTEGGGRGGRKS